MSRLGQIAHRDNCCKNDQFKVCIYTLLEAEKRLTASSPSPVQEMERTANSKRDRESAATIRLGKILVQETNRLQLPLAGKTAQQINMYISSASTPKDEMLLEELEKQLSVLKRQPKLYLWEKRLIAPGANWEQEISTFVNQAHLILFLVSPDFFASDQCYEEMELAIRRVKAKEVFVIPLLMRHTANWQDTPLGMLEPLPADRRPVSDRADREKAMSDIAERIRQVIEKIGEELTNSGS